MDIQSQQQMQPKTHAFSFSGTAAEYFGIWIVNLILSIITLGIYTAWAKVRRLRYFYGNTWLDGHNFEYRAKPVQILIGRIVVVILLVLFNVLAEFYPALALVLLVPYFLALPWLINKAFQFNARMSSYRNIRFGFEGSYGKALWVFVVLPLIVPVVFGGVAAGVLYFSGGVSGYPSQEALTALVVVGIGFLVAMIFIIPYISKQTNTYIANGMKFGAARFTADIGLRSLYRNLGLAIVVLLGVGVVVAALSGLFWLSGGGIGAAVFSQVAIFAVYVSVLVAYLAYAAGVRNIAFNATSIEGGHQLLSGIPRFGYAWIIISNLLVSVATIGLMIPWAAVRTWRYLSYYSALETTEGLDKFVSDQEPAGNVAAAEYLDIDGIDFGL